MRWLWKGAVCAMVIAASPAGAQTLPNAPVPQLDLARYLGQWHEIAHLPMYFQQQCIDTITATYSTLPDGQIRVHNACRTRNGMDAADGVARTTQTVGALKVRFAPAWLSWLSWVWADYWVVDLDPDYRWAVVGSPSKDYLWVLSREPGMSREQFNLLRDRAAQRGYPVDKLVMAAPLR